MLTSVKLEPIESGGSLSSDFRFLETGVLVYFLGLKMWGTRIGKRVKGVCSRKNNLANLKKNQGYECKSCLIIGKSY